MEEIRKDIIDRMMKYYVYISKGMIKNLIKMKHEKQTFILNFIKKKKMKNSMVGDDNDHDDEGEKTYIYVRLSLSLAASHRGSQVEMDVEKEKKIFFY